MDEMYYYWLHNVPGIGKGTFQKILKYMSPQELYECNQEKRCFFLSKKQREYIIKSKEKWNVLNEGERLQSKGTGLVGLGEKDYPKKLSKIPDPPPVLYYKGKGDILDKPSVAVIGARACSNYGSLAAKELGRELATMGIVVVSGMARGIDGISQMAALEAGGTSFGVLGCGVDVCYPAGNRALYQRLRKEGGILSSYPPGTQPQAALFPPRNRIVSGLSDVVIVVEARQKSGTLITVDMALEQGREVYCIPGRLTDRLSDGCNKLIKQGAGILLSPQDFLADLENLFPDRAHWSKVKIKEAEKEVKKMKFSKNIAERVILLDYQEARVLEQLDFMPQSVEQIRSRLNPTLTYAQTLQILMRLTLTSAVVQSAPGYFLKKTP